MSSNEKNTQKVESSPKKENISILERIRRRTGLLVGIVGLALIIFILESLLGSGASIFRNDESAVGYINGQKVDRNDFLTKFEGQLNQYRQRNQGQEIDESLRGQAIESVWQSYVADYAIVPQFAKAGITISEDELYQHVVVNPDQTVMQNLTDPNTGKVNPQVALPDGSLDLLKWKQAIQGANPETEAFVKQIEEQVSSTLKYKKYRNLIKKGIYVTTAEAKSLYQAQNTKLDISYVMKRFDAVKDSAVKVTDSDLQKYYNDNSYKFLNKEATRSIEYVTFNVLPSPDDVSAIEKEAISAADKLKGKTISEDSLVLAQESENGNIVIQNFNRQNMIVRDSSIYTSPIGTVFGPYNEGAYFKVYKLQAVNSVADSARVRHILVGLMDPRTSQPIRSKDRAKKMADSVLVLIKDKKANFDSLVVNFSDDAGSKTNGGDYGWFDENEKFVESYKEAGLMGVKGNISVVETQFGYHIIDVLDVSKTRHTSYKIAQAFKLIAPSEQTTQKIFNEANQFGGENNTAELFDKAVESQKRTKRLAGDIKEGERQLPGGLDRAKELVRWLFTANLGDVGVFTFSDKFVVAKVSAIKNKGVLPLDLVKEEVRQMVIKQKKAEMFIEELNTKGGSSKNVDEIASKTGMESKRQENLLMDAHNVEGVGHDDVLVGTAIGLKPGSISRPTISENGVFVVGVNKISEAPPTNDFKNQRLMIERELAGRADYESFNAIKEMSDIEDFKSKID